MKILKWMGEREKGSKWAEDLFFFFFKPLKFVWRLPKWKFPLRKKAFHARIKSGKVTCPPKKYSSISRYWFRLCPIIEQNTYCPSPHKHDKRVSSILHWPWTQDNLLTCNINMNTQISVQYHPIHKEYDLLVVKIMWEAGVSDCILLFKVIGVMGSVL